MKLVGMFAKSNIAFNAIEEAQDDLEEFAGKGLGIGGTWGLTDLVQPILQEQQKGYVKMLITVFTYSGWIAVLCGCGSIQDPSCSQGNVGSL
jgi:hypothetical protein